MNKKQLLKICDRGLLALTLLILASGIQLEVTHSNEITFVWLHIVGGFIFMSAIGWHIYLHFGWNNWFGRFRKLRSQATRILWWTYLLTFITGVIAGVHWIVSYSHSPIGGVHGKVGFIMILLTLAHIAKRIKFYKI